MQLALPASQFPYIDREKCSDTTGSQQSQDTKQRGRGAYSSELSQGLHDSPRTSLATTHEPPWSVSRFTCRARTSNSPAASGWCLC